MTRVSAALTAQLAAWTFLVLVVAGGSVPVRADERPFAYQVFNKFLNDSANAKVRDSAIDGGAAEGARQALAEEIVADILGASDPINGNTVPSFGFGFACLIWDAEIAPEYAHLLVVGKSKPVPYSKDVRSAQNGAIVKTGCFMPDPEKPPDKSIGSPCLGGGVVMLQEHTKRGLLLNGIVSYYRLAGSGDCTRQTCGPAPSIWLKHFQSRLEAATHGSLQKRFTNAASAAKIDLTQVAFDFYRCRGFKCGKRAESLGQASTAQTSCKRSRTSHFKGDSYQFLVIAVVPFYGLPQQLPRGYLKSWSSNFLGLAAAGGQVVVDHVHVPMPEDLDLNRPAGAAPSLYIVTVVPNQASYEYPKGPCPECD